MLHVPEDSIRRDAEDSGRTHSARPYLLWARGADDISAACVMWAVVLAGGLGTRLRAAVSDVPKPLAPVGGRPFLSYLLDHLARNGFTDVVLATGYLGEKVVDAFGKRHGSVALHYSCEHEPLG